MDKENFHATERFSDRVDDYIKYRPSYPPQIIEILSPLGLKPSSIIVDVGSGTGISAELFLKNGNIVYAVEPNEQMRTAAEGLLKHYPQFHSINGTSEQTHLPEETADFIVAAQAFHWFEPQATKAEFQRILKENGYVVLIWNKRIVSASAFSQDYEALIDHVGSDYKAVKRHLDSLQIQEFLGSQNYGFFKLYNSQDLDFAGLLGRFTSCSFIPKKDEAGYEEMYEKLKKLFVKYQKNGLIKIEYDTEIYFSQFKTSARG